MQNIMITRTLSQDRVQQLVVGLMTVVEVFRVCPKTQVFNSTSWCRLSCSSFWLCHGAGFNTASWCRLVSLPQSLVQQLRRMRVRQSPQGPVLFYSDVEEECEGDVEEEEEDEEDEDLDEVDGTQSRFPAGFQPMRMCRWYSAGNFRQEWWCMFAHSTSRLRLARMPWQLPRCLTIIL